MEMCNLYEKLTWSNDLMKVHIDDNVKHTNHLVTAYNYITIYHFLNPNLVFFLINYKSVSNT